MPRTKTTNISPAALEVIGDRIFPLRGHRVMLDRDLAELYGVPLKRLNEQVKRNWRRFPADFMLQLSLKEGKALAGSRSQIATLNRGHNVKYAPKAFTEHGALMLANVLKSPLAIRASIQVVRAFLQFRHLLGSNAELAHKLEALERKVGKHDEDLEAVPNMLRQILEPPLSPQRAIALGR